MSDVAFVRWLELFLEEMKPLERSYGLALWRVSDNRLREVLRTSEKSDEVREAWESSKQIGPQVAPRILELVDIRNSIARRLGYPDFHQMSLILDEIEPDWLFRLLEELEEVT